MSWISVKDRLPECDYGASVLVCNEKRRSNWWIASYYKDGKIFLLNDPSVHMHPLLDVTHWMLIPPVPLEK